MLQNDMRLQAPHAQAITGGALQLGELIDIAFGLLRRNFLLILFTTLIGTTIGAGYVLYAPPLYSASSQIILDPRRAQVFHQQPVLAEPPLDVATVESQMQVLQSDAIALAVVKNLKLSDDPTFIEQSKGVASGLFSLLTDRLFSLPNRLFRPPTRSSTSPLKDIEREVEAVAAIEQNLRVARVGTSYVIDINFRSRSPERAAQIANAVAEAFLADQIETRNQSMQRTTAWLQDRLGELRDQQRNADRSLADFQAKHATDGQATKQDDLNVFNKELIAARNRTSEAQAKLDRIEAIIASSNSASTSGAPDPTVSDTLTNSVITKFREKYLEYAAREADYSAKYGSNHFAVVNLRRQMRDLRASILDELRRIAETYKSDLEIAKHHQNDSEKAFADAVAQSGVSQGPLRELQGSADAYRTIYEGLLQRYVQSVQEQSLPTTEARLLTRASPPTSKSGSKALLIGALISIGGLMLGVGIGVFRHMTDRFFRTSDQVETALSIECISIVPHVSPRTRPRLGVVNGRASIFSGRGIMWNTIDAPFSRYAEAIRAVKFAVDSNKDALASKVIGVTSSLPNEGKSTLAGSLALLAADTGAKTILVDCDLRNPQLSRKLAPNVKFGLLNIIAGDESIEQAVITDASTGLAFLPAGLSSKDQAQFKHGVHSNERLGSEAVRKVFEQLRERYEYVIVDLSPIAPVVDVRSTARFIDLYVFAVAWGSTRVGLVAHALKQANGICAKLICVVLNKTPLTALGQYQGHLKEYYNSKEFKRYGQAGLKPKLIRKS
jgi:succinoglycan biosynthesis transport protein ExoP